MDAIIIAGGIPAPDEPLYEYTKGSFKALIDLAGKPMIQWILDALSDSDSVERVVVVGISEEDCVNCKKDITYIPNQGDMVENVRAGVMEVIRLNPQAVKVLMVSSDIPTITPEMVDWLIDNTQQDDLDVYYNVITREVMEARFPTSKRSFTHLKGMDVCGGDMNVMATRMVTSNDELWDKLVAARKSPLKQASLIGFDTLLLLLFRAVTLERAVELVTKRLNITGRAIVCPYAEIGMDVDKPHQLEIVRSELERSRD
jgi:GTP:adenosylcobinamide-phosphate guanylyltransferase